MRLGPYEVVAALGAGGMGEVFRARDLRLGRDVALKVLGERFMLEPQRVARFERETRVLASLNHPNIATLHGVEQIDRTHALVMELVEGETLAERLAHGPMPLRETLDIAEQIAAALEAAHEHGVVHRDLKPANVKVRPDGTVKLLDFGLAKAFGQALVGSEPGDATATSLDAAGTILGTPGYMSPEQARALPIDKRTDVWAFGCVLFEMLAGQRAFDGERTSDVIAKVIEREPDYGAIPAATPPRLVRLLRRLLAKDPRQRLRDCGDARLELQELGSPRTDADADNHGDRATARRRAPWLALGALGGAAAVVVALALAGFLARPDSRPVTRFTIALPSSQVLQFGAYQTVAISPAASEVAYITDSRVYVRALSELEPRPLAGTDEQGPVGGILFSPDGRWLAYYSQRYKELRKVPLGGGQPTRIAAAENYLGGSWGDDDRIVFAQTDGIFAVSGGGGTAALLIAADGKRGELALNPTTLPGNTGVLFTLVTSSANGGERAGRSVVLQTPGSGERRVVIEGGRDARYVAETRRLIYEDSGALMAVPFDAARARPTGAPLAVASSVSRSPVNDPANFAVARDGSLAYQRVTLGSSTLTWVDRDGHREPVGAPAESYEYFRVAPDGTKIAAATHDQGEEVYVWDIASRSFTRLTFNPEYDGYPLWAPDSKRVIFQSAVGGHRTIARKNIDGTGSTETLFVAGGTDLFNLSSITPDGAELVFRRITSGGANELWTLPLDRAGDAKPLLAMEHDQQIDGEISPDGHWLAYQSNESGRFEIYLRPFPDVDGGRWEVSSGGGVQPAWRRDGHGLFYLLTDRRLVEVEVSGGATPVIGAPRVALLSVGYTPYDRSGRQYEVTADGRFLVTEAATGPAVTFDVVLGGDREPRDAR
jgi:serine/threonine-protein kinase